MGLYDGPKGEHNPWVYAAAANGIANTTTAVTLKAAASAGYRSYITDLQISHATLGGATELLINDGAGGTVLHRMTLGTVANENIVVHFRVPLRSSLATLLEVKLGSAVTGGVYVNAQGYDGY